MSKSKQAAVPFPRTTFLAVCVFLIVASAAVYFQVGWFPFVDLDDGPYVCRNHFVYDPITPRGIHWAFTAFHSANWHPLTWISHMIDCQVYGLNHPGGHHVTSLVLHVVNALLLFLVLLRMTGSGWRSGFVAALFALHPLHVESVAWISERKDLLSTFFALLTLLAYVGYTRRRGAGRYILVMCLYALGLMSKPMLVSLPLILLMLDWWPLKRLDDAGTSLWRLVMEKLPLFALALASCFVTYLAQLHGHAAQTLTTYSLPVRAANALVAYAAYVIKMVWPAGLSPLYPHPGATLPIWQPLAAAVAFVSVTALVIVLRRKLPYVFVGWLWYVVMLVPVIGLVQVGLQAMADRYTYLPLVGLFILITWSAADLLERSLPSRCRWVLLSTAVAILVVLSACSWVQVGHWRSTDALCRRALQVSNGDASIRIFVAESLARRGKTRQAIRLLTEAPNDSAQTASLNNTLGMLLLRERKVAEAEACFKLAIRARPDQAAPYANFGFVRQMQGRSAEAVRWYLKAIKLDPYYPSAHRNLGIIYAELGDSEDALREFDKAAALDPEDADARWRAAYVVSQQGLADEAIERLRDAIEVDPHSFEAHYLLGRLLYQQGDASVAVSHLQVAAKINPRAGAPHQGLAVALFAQGDYAGAWREAEAARQLGSRMPAAFLNALSERMPEPAR